MAGHDGLADRGPLRVLQSTGRVHWVVREADWKRSEEDTVDLDPDDARRYLEGVDYPASKADLLAAAQANNAPESFTARLRDLPEGSEFSGPEEAADALRGLAGGG